MRALRWMYTGWGARARRFGNWTGLRDKTLIDYIQLIVLPFVLIVGGQLVSQAVNASARAQALEDAQERRLQDYLVRSPTLLSTASYWTLTPPVSGTASSARSLARGH